MSKNLDGFNADSDTPPPSARSLLIEESRRALDGLALLAESVSMDLAVRVREGQMDSSVNNVDPEFATRESLEDWTQELAPDLITDLLLPNGKLPFAFPAPKAPETPTLTAMAKALDDLTQLAYSAESDQLSRGLVSIQTARQLPIQG